MFNFKMLWSLLLPFMMYADEPGSGGGGGEPSGGEPSGGGGEPSGGGEPGALLAGEGDPPAGDDPGKGGEPAGKPTPDPQPKQSIHGDLSDKIQWPEGFEDELKEDPTLKKFVKEDGSIDYANALKSYHHAQKQIGKDKVVIPDEKYATQEDWDDFWSKVGFKKDPEQYNLEPPKESALDDDFIKDFKNKAHEARLPEKQAQEMLKFFDERSKTYGQKAQEQQQEQITEQINQIKEQYGEAFNQKINMAKNVIKDFGDDEVKKAMSDPSVGSNPNIVKLLVNVAEKFYGEDKHVGDTSYTGALSPQEAQERIDGIYGDPKHPYHDPHHPNHKKAQDEVFKLFQYKNRER